MLKQLFPDRVDNAYRGYQLAPWLLALAMFMKIAMSLGTIFNGRVVASSADGIPLDTFTPAAAQAVVFLLALLGLATLMICLLGVLVLVRYRRMVPLMFALLLMQYLGGRLIAHFIPMVRTGTPPGFYINIVLLVVMLVGFVLSLLPRSGEPA